MNQIGQSIKKLSIFQNDYDNDNDNDNDDTHPPWIIVRVGMIFRRGQKSITLSRLDLQIIIHDQISALYISRIAMAVSPSSSPKFLRRRKRNGHALKDLKKIDM